jgi:hypothetical protein
MLGKKTQNKIAAKKTTPPCFQSSTPYIIRLPPVMILAKKFGTEGSPLQLGERILFCLFFGERVTHVSPGLKVAPLAAIARSSSMPLSFAYPSRARCLTAPVIEG